MLLTMVYNSMVVKINIGVKELNEYSVKIWNWLICVCELTESSGQV